MRADPARETGVLEKHRQENWCMNMSVRCGSGADPKGPQGCESRSAASTNFRAPAIQYSLHGERFIPGGARGGHLAGDLF
jgi:hypothetical protein